MHTRLLMAPGNHFLFSEIKYCVVNVNELSIRNSYEGAICKNITSVGTLIGYYTFFLFLKSIFVTGL